MCRSQMQIALHKRKCHLMSKKRSHRCSHLPFTVWKLLHISSSNSCCLSCWNWLSWMFLIWYPEWVQKRSEQLELQPGRLEEAGSSGFFPLFSHCYWHKVSDFKRENVLTPAVQFPAFLVGRVCGSFDSSVILKEKQSGYALGKDACLYRGWAKMKWSFF